MTSALWSRSIIPRLQLDKTLVTASSLAQASAQCPTICLVYQKFEEQKWNYLLLLNTLYFQVNRYRYWITFFILNSRKLTFIAFNAQNKWLNLLCCSRLFFCRLQKRRHKTEPPFQISLCNANVIPGIQWFICLLKKFWTIPVPVSTDNILGKTNGKKYP